MRSAMAGRARRTQAKAGSQRPDGLIPEDLLGSTSKGRGALMDRCSEIHACVRSPNSVSARIASRRWNPLFTATWDRVNQITTWFCRPVPAERLAQGARKPGPDAAAIRISSATTFC
jgi:hypothetical protein